MWAKENRWYKTKSEDCILSLFYVLRPNDRYVWMSILFFLYIRRCMLMKEMKEEKQMQCSHWLIVCTYEEKCNLIYRWREKTQERQRWMNTNKTQFNQLNHLKWFDFICFLIYQIKFLMYSSFYQIVDFWITHEGRSLSVSLSLEWDRYQFVELDELILVRNFKHNILREKQV